MVHIKNNVFIFIQTIVRTFLLQGNSVFIGLEPKRTKEKIGKLKAEKQKEEEKIEKKGRRKKREKRKKKTQPKVNRKRRRKIKDIKKREKGNDKKYR